MTAFHSPLVWSHRQAERWQKKKTTKLQSRQLRRKRRAMRTHQTWDFHCLRTYFCCQRKCEPLLNALRRRWCQCRRRRCASCSRSEAVRRKKKKGCCSPAVDGRDRWVVSWQRPCQQITICKQLMQAHVAWAQKSYFLRMSLATSQWLPRCAWERLIIPEGWYKVRGKQEAPIGWLRDSNGCSKVLYLQIIEPPTCTEADKCPSFLLNSVKTNKITAPAVCWAAVFCGFVLTMRDAVGFLTF